MGEGVQGALKAQGWSRGEDKVAELWRPEVTLVYVFQTVTILVRLCFTVK